MKGILFKPDMIKAVMEGQKTQTRRVAKDINDLASHYDHCWTYFDKKDNWWLLKGRSRITDVIEPFVIKPRYLPGETVYVKEAWSLFGFACDNAAFVHYKLGHGESGNERLLQLPLQRKPMFPSLEWRSPMFMPEWAARTRIKILDARPERLQDMTEAERKAEGTTPRCLNGQPPYFYLAAFASLWDGINPKNPWSSNPWVWQYTFEKVKQ